MKVWAKIMNEDKILKDIIFEGDYSLTSKDFNAMVQEITYKLDFFTPIILDTHIKRFAQFNRVKFLPRDFVDGEGFTSFVLERVLDEKKKPTGYFY